VDLKKEGKVKDIGVSNYLKHHLQDLLAHSEVKPAINQFEIHPLLW
jgi:diketogulonate reductase-like aldo/keto reductase